MGARRGKRFALQWKFIPMGQYWCQVYGHHCSELCASQTAKRNSAKYSSIILPCAYIFTSWFTLVAAFHTLFGNKNLVQCDSMWMWILLPQGQEFESLAIVMCRNVWGSELLTSYSLVGVMIDGLHDQKCVKNIGREISKKRPIGRPRCVR